MFGGGLFFLGHAVLLLTISVHHACGARSSSNHNCTSSCGNIPNISHPFRLKTDPRECGRKEYELVCEDNLHAVVYLESVKHYVQAINYNNLTIRLVDANLQKDNCLSVPSHSFSGYSFSHWEYWLFYKGKHIYGTFGHCPYTSSIWNAPESEFSDSFQSIAFVHCLHRVNFPSYVETSSSYNNMETHNSCSSTSSSISRGYSYAVLGPTTASDLADSCRVDLMAMTSLPPKHGSNVSFADVHNSIVYGFELSWLTGLCKSARGRIYDLDDSHRVCCPPLHQFMGVTLGNLWVAAAGAGTGARPLDFLYVAAMVLTANVAAKVLGAIELYHALLFFCGAPCVIIFLIYKWRRRHLSMFDNIEEFLQTQDNLMPIRYSYSDIKKMTAGFKDNLGEGGYGTVYKGKLRSGRLVAVKMLGKAKANGQEFINEVATIGRVHHVNIVQLLGFCVEGAKRALIYEFMPNGSLDKYIFSTEGGDNPLSNRKMYEISIGIARGIEYLHQGCDMQILHFDIKPHNILLDENFAPKVSDFGLAKSYQTDKSIVSLTAARGTLGYMAPELFYKNLGGVSYRADVYSFGMLLMEMAGRRKNLNAYEERLSQIYFPSWVYDQISQGKDVELVEAATEEDKQMLKKMIMTALWCIQLKPSDRLSMHKVVEMLEGDVGCIKMPPKPFVTPQEMKQEEEMELAHTQLRQEQASCSSSELVADVK